MKWLVAAVLPLILLFGMMEEVLANEITITEQAASYALAGNANLPKIENAYPGYVIKESSIAIQNQTEQTAFYLDYAVEFEGLAAECYEIMLQVADHTGAILAAGYPLELQELNIPKGTSVSLTPIITLSGEQIDNTQQDANFTICYEVRISQSSRKLKEQRAKAQTFPQTGEQVSWLLIAIGGILIGSAVFLRKRT